MEEATVKDPEKTPEDKDYALRPKFLKEFIGHDKLRENLGIFIKSAKKRSQPIDHTIFYGPPGLGKTTLSQIISREMGVEFHMTSGPVVAKAGDLAAILTNLQAGDVLFIDEIHRLSPIVEEILYPAMEDFSLDLVVGSGPAARTVRIELKPFTLIGATTRLGLLTTPLRDRFGIDFRLDFYSVDQLNQIVERSANLMKITIESEGSLEIAKRARGTPRIANRLLTRVVDFAIVEGDGMITEALAKDALERMGVDFAGLDAADRKYLNIISDFYQGGPVGVETIAAAMSEARDSIEDVVEPFLLQSGYIQRTPRGRMLTPVAWSHLKKKPPKVEMQGLDIPWE